MEGPTTLSPEQKQSWCSSPMLTCSQVLLLESEDKLQSYLEPSTVADSQPSLLSWRARGESGHCHTVCRETQGEQREGL